ncbi:MAG TPA: polyprenol monophosphomannose synthase [Rhodothermales bacterium]|nr:polyprenol monophosphomannose synthase [Rhodothermales bacterium]
MTEPAITLSPAPQSANAVVTGRALVIIPTYNERANIRHVLDLVMALPGHVDVLVIDDGSPDGTAALIGETQKTYPGRIHLIVRAGKQGLGTAYRLGFGFALEQGYDYICEMDADLSHNPNDLPRLITPVAENDADLAIGSRYADGVRVMNWPLSRLILSYGAGIYTRAITRLPVYDVTAGFKCYHRRVLEAIDLNRVKSNGYSFQVEMKYRTWRAGFRLMEVPIVFTERTEGQSKMSKAIVREAAWKVWELRFRALFGSL